VDANNGPEIQVDEETYQIKTIEAFLSGEIKIVGVQRDRYAQGL
jgi:hypothetical protein